MIQKKTYFFALILFCTISSKTGVLRGESYPKWIDKLYRTIFYLFLMFPFLSSSSRFLRNLTFLFSLFYLPLYLDGSENGKNKKFERKNGILGRLIRGSRYWKWIKKRYNLQLILTKPLSPKPYIFAIHPHAILPLGISCNLMSNINNSQELLKGIDYRFLGASMAFSIPIYRDICLALGNLDAAPHSAKGILSSGKSIMVVPGGAQEALLSFPLENKILINNRKGFIKLALEFGVDLVPVYSFGETDLYNQIKTQNPIILSIQNAIHQAFGISFPILTNIIPIKSNITTVIGEPIEVKKIINPTKEDIDILMNIYKEKLLELFNTNKSKYIVDGEKAQLEFF